MSTGEILFAFSFLIELGVIAIVLVINYLDRIKAEEYNYD